MISKRVFTGSQGQAASSKWDYEVNYIPPFVSFGGNTQGEVVHLTFHGSSCDL